MDEKNNSKKFAGRFWRYPKIFWDDPETASASPCALKAKLERWRASDSEADKMRMRDFVRRMIERGSITDARFFLKSEEARAFFENETAYFLDGRLDELWLEFSGLPKSFPLKRKLDGNRKNKRGCW